jgi:hypothetical protein
VRGAVVEASTDAARASAQDEPQVRIRDHFERMPPDLQIVQLPLLPVPLVFLPSGLVGQGAAEVGRENKSTEVSRD